MGKRIYDNDEQRAIARKEAQTKYYQKTHETRLQKQKEYDTKNKEAISERRKERYRAKKLAT